MLPAVVTGRTSVGPSLVRNLTSIYPASDENTDLGMIPHETKRMPGSIARSRNVSSDPVRVELFDLLGRSVRVVYEGFLQGGVSAEIAVDGRGLLPGEYYLRAMGSGFMTSRAIVRL